MVPCESQCSRDDLADREGGGDITRSGDATNTPGDQECSGGPVDCVPIEVVDHDLGSCAGVPQLVGVPAADLGS